MALPTFVAVGTHANVVFPSPTTVAVPLPAGIATDDILVLLIVSGATAVKGVVTNANGGTWSELPGSPVVGASGAQGTFLWSRYNGTQGNPTIGTSVTANMMGVIAAVRGCPTSGDPWDGTPPTYVDTSVTTSVTFPGYTTGVADILYLMLLMTDENNGAANTVVGTFTNAALANLTERFDQSASANLGGGIAIVTGEKVTPGAIGNSTATLSTGGQRRLGLGLGLKPGGPPPGRHLLLMGVGS